MNINVLNDYFVININNNYH